MSEEAPKPHKKGKFNQGNGEEMQPGQQMMPPQHEGSGPPPPPKGDMPPGGQHGNGKHKKDNGKATCPEGAVQLEDGSCVVPH